jgi:hypothetical protein
MEDIHMKHLVRIMGGQTPVTAGTIQQFVDARSRKLHQGHPVKPKTVRKFDAKLVLLREKKRSRERETFRTVGPDARSRFSSQSILAVVRGVARFSHPRRMFPSTSRGPID